MGCKRTNITVLLVTFLITLLHSNLSHGLQLPHYETLLFSNPSRTLEFTRVAFNETGTIYIGGADRLYRLGADFMRHETVDTAVDCDEDDCPLNYNKILLVDNKNNNVLVTCGSESNTEENVLQFGGTCQTRSLDRITEVIREDSSVVVTHGKLSTEAVITPGPDNGGVDTLYVATTFDEGRYPEVVPVSRRTYAASETSNIIFNKEREAEILLDMTTKYPNTPFIIDYVYGFVKERTASETHYTYFVTSQRQDFISQDDMVYVSKINRVCQENDFSSYAEITLKCASPSDNYNLIQAAYVGPAGADLAVSLGLTTGDDVLYGVFAMNTGVDGNIPSTESALCVFKLEDIEEKFIDGIHGCLQQGGAYRLNYLPGDTCPGIASVTPEQAIGQQCSANNWANANNFNPLVSTAAVEWTDITPSSIITTTHRNHTIAFVGTSDGQLVKTHIVGASEGREYERFSLGTSSSPAGQVLRNGGAVDEEKKHVTLLTQQKLLKLNVSNCGGYTTCDECIGGNGGQDGDPYCGWCTLERRCTRYSECPMPDKSTRWLPYNSAQCVSISDVGPYDSLPITVTRQEITLTVEQLPDLDGGESYQCIFDDIPAVPATKDGNVLTCTTPAASDIPGIPMGSDHVTMQLFVFSTEHKSKFVQIDFYFYECDTHKGCIACTSSSWACDWCIYSNKCTHDNSTCSMEDDVSSIINGMNNPVNAPRKGPEECPQLVAQEGEILIPVGVSRSITVTGMNLPDKDRTKNYKCILDIEGTAVETGADRNGDIFTCSVQMYNYAVDDQELDVSLSVLWNNDRKLDDIHDFTVTLYKCSVGRPHCSRCLSNTTTKPQLNCGWCSQDDMCTVEGGSCSGGFMSASGGQNCGAPNITKVSPPSGTLNGNTTIAISGTDLGRQFSDILSVKVGDKDCDIDGLEEDYEVGSSVSCITMPGEDNAMEAITVTVRGKDGNEQRSTGNAVFTYRDPSISSIDPQEGPEAGGTIVTFTGQYLDACSEISATIGSECIMNRMSDVLNSTTARCRTTSSPVGSSHILSVTFDGVTTKQSEDKFMYKNNPEVNDVQPRKTIESGGITLTITGIGLNLVQTPQMVMYVAEQQFTESCEIHNDTMMLCKTPSTNTNSISRRRRRQAGPLGSASFGFIIGDVSDLLTWSEDNNITMEYFEDPEYMLFEENPEKVKGDILQIKGRNLDAGSTERDVTVYIGTKEAEISTLGEDVLTVMIPSKDPGRRCRIERNTTSDTCVVVYHGNIGPIYIGDIRYPPADDFPLEIIIVIAVICALLIGTLVIVMILYRRRVKGHEKNIGKLLVEMQDMETNIAADIHDAFVKLQTDVTDLTSDLDGTGMPFVPHRQYAISMFFTGLEDRPTTFDPEETDADLDSATLALSKLLGDKTFLMALIQILDEDKSVPNKDRLSIASLLTVLMILEDKLPYLTDVMVTLLSGQVEDAIEDGKPTRLFQRTELIMEKLLSNWIALSLYDFLKDHAAYPLFLMYRAIKCQTEKGPIDMVTGKSYVSLNDENIISERLTFEEMKLDVIVNDEDGEKKEVAVLDTDSIGQAKSKILDAVYRNVPYSTRMQPWQVDLEWRTGRSGHLVLKDVDVSSDTEPGWKRVNTLKHFSVPTGSNVALANRQEVPNATVAGQAATRYSNIRDSTSLPNFTFGSDETKLEDGVQLWHLVKGDADWPQEGDRINRRKSVIHNKKQIREVTFPRLLGTKGIVQEYMDKMFAAILNTGDVPIGVKYIFDIFDSLAARNNIEDETVLHKWKSNILPLRFWQKIITNPQYIFDIGQSQCVEASLSVISQAFYDAFRISNEQIGKDAPYRRLLYNREIPKYRDMVKAYYSSVNEMQRVSKATLDQDLKAICIKFAGLFSHVSTLMKLYGHIDKYKKKLMDALENDEIYEESGLAEKLEHVLSIMPDSARQEPQYAYRNDVIMEEDEENA